VNWKPIETIPRDGTRVRLCNKSGLEDFGNWYDFQYWTLAEHGAPFRDWEPAIPGVWTGDLDTDQGYGDYTHWDYAP
jgi:hypothetical protein